ncbi:MAG: ABC transporter ATP-binding protein/permease [bacterium]|nr:ABC transporter ATP-binding protein/permease [bacterium]
MITASYGLWVPIAVLLVTCPRLYLKIKHGNFVWSMYGSGAPQAKKLWYFGWLLSEKEPILETHIFQAQPTLLKKMKDIQEHLYDINKKPLDNYRWVLIFAPIIETSVIFIIVVHFLPQVLKGNMSIGSVALLLASLSQLKNHTSSGAARLGELYENNLFIAPFFELINLPKLILEKKSPKSIKPVRPPKIEFKNVSFEYPNGHKVLKNVSFTIEPGENIAFVGNNGAGKTTIIKLLCIFYDVTEGEILINGFNIKSLKLTNWYEHLGTLFQDFMKYNFTVKENIMLGLPSLKDEKRMKMAAIESGAIEFIEKFPNKFDQILGRRFDGEELSGGQWQKLAIARALYQQAPVLIMDEPTSAIDAQAEYEIFNSLERHYKDKTLILVSHRFSTVRNANKIIVIDDGELIEQGTHNQLLKLNAKYAAMFNTQAKGYK